MGSCCCLNSIKNAEKTPQTEDSLDKCVCKGAYFCGWTIQDVIYEREQRMRVCNVTYVAIPNIGTRGGNVAAAVLIDFGCTERFTPSVEGDTRLVYRHHFGPMRVEYAAVAQHTKDMVHPFDDIESLCYVALLLVQGSLSWEKLPLLRENEDYEESKEERSAREHDPVVAMKRHTLINARPIVLNEVTESSPNFLSLLLVTQLFEELHRQRIACGINTNFNDGNCGAKWMFPDYDAFHKLTSVGQI